MRSDCAFAHPSKALQCTRQTGSIPVGAEVFAKPKNDAIFPFEWSIGTVSSFRGSAYKVDFPEVQNWAVEEKDLRLAMSGSSTDGRTARWVTMDHPLLGWGLMDDSVYKLGFASCCGKVGGKFQFTGNVDTSQDRHRWEYGFVHGEQELTPSRPYFEVKIVADTPSGVCIGLTGSSFSAGSMVGWCHPWVPTSIGFHSDNGKFYGGPNKEKRGNDFGPISSKGDSIGCGINFDADGKPKTVFFTRNKKEVWRCKWQSENLLFPVVTSASPAIVQLNLTATLPSDSAGGVQGIQAAAPPNLPVILCTIFRSACFILMTLPLFTFLCCLSIDFRLISVAAASTDLVLQYQAAMRPGIDRAQM